MGSLQNFNRNHLVFPNPISRIRAPRLWGPTWICVPESAVENPCAIVRDNQKMSIRGYFMNLLWLLLSKICGRFDFLPLIYRGNTSLLLLLSLIDLINPALQPNSSRTRSKTTKELKPMLFKPVQCQSCQTKCTQCCTFHLLRFCITTSWFWRNFGIMKFSASQRLTCQTKWLNAGLSILHVSAL